MSSSISAEQYQYDRVASQKPAKIVSLCIGCNQGRQLLGTKNTTHILLINLSLLTGLPFLPPDTLGISVHISLTFSNTMLQCRSKALTRAKSLRLLRQEMRTWVWERTAVWRIESGPEVNSCSSSRAISYSLQVRRTASASRSR